MLSRIARVLVGIVVVTFPVLGQQRAYTDADYQRAEKFMGYNTNPLVLHSGVRPVWLPDDRFWYRVSTEPGYEFILVDPVRGTRAQAFDQARIAAALSSAAGSRYETFRLPFTTF